ncbi:histidine kinase [Nonomuraea sp. NPDC050536]|uniref:histidine kinase n=1 Tax=Nonomuraea sp. NPDC050536 TaxID=3364366 RepID=UPI0037C73857
MASNLAEDHDRIAADLNDGLIHRMFALSLDLHAALTLLGDHQAAEKISLAISGLHQAIKDLRTTIYDLRPPA